MCLVTPTRMPYVAPEDIYCYKVLNEVDGKLVTPYRGFPMELGKVYTAEDVSEADDNELSDGFFHAYASPSYMYKTNWSFSPRKECAMYLAIIPKGTKFFVNPNCTEICATAIKVISKVSDIGRETLFETTATDVAELAVEHSAVNHTFDTFKDSLTTMEGIIKYAKDNNLYSDILHKYETFEEGSYERNLYAYRLIVAVLTENEKNSLTNGNCYYPYVDFYNGTGCWNPGIDQVEIGTVVSGGTAYIVVVGGATHGAGEGLGCFNSNSAASYSWADVGFRSVSRREIAEFISRHFGRLIFDLMYGCSNCDYRWVEEND